MAVRELTSADRPALEAFTCARLGEPWAEAIQHAVRNDLPGEVAAGRVSAVGLFDPGGTLGGVAAWRIHTATPPVLCRSDIVAVAVDEQRRGCGRLLKEVLVARARDAGAVAVSSIVHRGNVAMIRLNEQFGAVVELMEDESDHCLCVIGLR